MAAASTKVSLQRIPLNKTDIDQGLLNIERKERRNPLPWNGQFSPQLVEVLLSAYASEGATVLDPFAGSGTLLLEASSKKLTALGADINPAACYLARVYTLTNEPLTARRELCESLERLLYKYIPHEPALIDSDGERSHAKEKVRMVQLIRREVAKNQESTLPAALLVLCDFFDSKSQFQDLFEAWKRLRNVVLSLPESSFPIKVFNSDARRLPVSDQCIDLVITSPPYINVLNYHQHFRRTVEALGWHLLRVAHAEIGSNRKHRGNRFLTVVQYCLDITQAFKELRRVCKRRSRVIFVVGRESRVRGVPFYNGSIIASIAEAVGFELITRQERVFINRFGQSIFEDILHLVPRPRNSDDPMASARELGVRCLCEAVSSDTGEVQADIREAIRLAPTVRASPLYQKANAFSRPDRTGELSYDFIPGTAP